MKKYNLFLLSLLLISGCSKESLNWYDENLEVALINADDKIIMIDFYTDW